LTQDLNYVPICFISHPEIILLYISTYLSFPAGTAITGLTNYIPIDLLFKSKSLV